MNLQTWLHRIALHLRSSYEWRKSPFGAASSDVQTRSIYGGIWARNWWTKGLLYSLDGFKGKSSPETIVLTIRYGGFWLKLSLKQIQWNIENLHVPKRQIADLPGGGLRLYPISSSRMGDDQRSKTLSLYVESQGRLRITFEDIRRHIQDGALQ